MRYPCQTSFTGLGLLPLSKPAKAIQRRMMSRYILGTEGSRDGVDWRGCHVGQTLRLN